MPNKKISKTKLLTLKSELERLESTILRIKQTINEIITPEMQAEETGEQIIEGIFDGEFMVKDEKKYPIPPNYASKSKLVQGDKMKLKILADGSFIYKQIEPVERKNLVGVLEEDEKGYKVRVKDRSYRVLLASITYYNAQAGDNISIIVPENEDSKWAAVEGLV
ncbi:MAG: hypothetical protein CEN92_158 [Candidatus Berkelbacteria bacterium Licking1014_96]|uniref:50S ribosomal protein L7/L12 n=1 Tax=Candidatus Berkelbacteria bacterium Licking1014_96 TaxID=2017149 RepID=A0A554LGR9_9BACT|nr:MAG: hypothetical protein CEN92_158 [Candidatus Berkelbacteria bacterium Licking1014_96]